MPFTLKRGSKNNSKYGGGFRTDSLYPAAYHNMADIVYVSSEEFAKLKQKQIGLYVQDSVGAEMILYEENQIRIKDF